MTMSPHSPSPSDLDFLNAFKSAKINLQDFDHRAHLKLAYVLLCSESAEASAKEIGNMIRNALNKNKMDTSKFNVTMTHAWTEAVLHFMHQTPTCRSANEFLEQNVALLDSRIMLSHYSEKRLYCEDARHHYLPADISPIPVYA